MRGRVLSPSHLLSVAAFCVGGGWLWNLTSTLQREPSGKDGAEASLRAGSHIAEEPASLTQAPQLWSNQSHKTEGEDRRCQEGCIYVSPLLGAQGLRGGASQGPLLREVANGLAPQAPLPQPSALPLETLAAGSAGKGLVR